MKFIGELGNLLSPLVVVTRKPQGTGLSDIGLATFRTLADSVPITWLDIDEFFTYKDVRGAIRRNQKILFTELPSLKPRLIREIAERDRDRSFLSVIYVWDSSEIPSEDSKNLRLFDEIFVPNQELVEVLEAQGLKAQLLPIALDSRSFAHIGATKSQKVTRNVSLKILSIGSFHPRKNHDLTIRSIVKLLDQGRDVSLRIHSNLDFDSYFEKLQKLVPDDYKEKIKISVGHLSNAEILNLYREADVYISLSSGETFNIGLRNAVSANLKVVATSVAGHMDLGAYPNVKLIKCEIPIPAIYPERGNRIYGLQFCSKIEDVCDALSVSSLNKLRPLEGIVDWDFRLIKEFYKEKIFARGPKSIRRFSIQVLPHDGGFFSLFNAYMSMRRSWSGHYQIADVTPLWDVREMISFFGSSNFQSFCYGKRADGNFFWKLFGLKKGNTDETERASTAIQLHSFNSFADPDLTYVHAARLYRSAAFLQWRHSMHRVFQEFVPSNQIQSRVEQTYSGVEKNTFIISMHVRHPSHAIEQPDKKIALARDYIRVARDFEAEYSLKNPQRKVKFFLATDQEQVIEIFKQEFGSQLLTVANVTRTSKEHDAAYELLDSKDQLREGHQIQHLMSSDEKNWSTNLAEEVIVDALCLARADLFLHSVSNVATAVSFMNPDLEMLLVNGGDSLKSSELRRQISSITGIL